MGKSGCSRERGPKKTQKNMIVGADTPNIVRSIPRVSRVPCAENLMLVWRAFDPVLHQWRTWTIFHLWDRTACVEHVCASISRILRDSDSGIKENRFCFSIIWRLVWGEYSLSFLCSLRWSRQEPDSQHHTRMEFENNCTVAICWNVTDSNLLYKWQIHGY